MTRFNADNMPQLLGKEAGRNVYNPVEFVEYPDRGELAEKYRASSADRDSMYHAPAGTHTAARPARVEIPSCTLSLPIAVH